MSTSTDCLLYHPTARTQTDPQLALSEPWQAHVDTDVFRLVEHDHDGWQLYWHGHPQTPVLASSDEAIEHLVAELSSQGFSLDRDFDTALTRSQRIAHLRNAHQLHLDTAI